MAIYVVNHGHHAVLAVVSGMSLDYSNGHKLL